MRIDSPKMTNAEVTGSFKGAFSGSFEGDIQADSVSFGNVTGKPTLFSGSAQIVYGDIPSIPSVGDGGLTTNNFTDDDHSKLDGIEANATADQTGAEIKSAYEAESDTNAFTDTLKNKLDGISGTNTGDQDLSAYQLQPSEGAFVNGDKTKLDNIESNATADQSNAEIRAAVEAASDSNVFTDADHSKLDGIEANATADQDLTSYQLKPTEGAFVNGDKTKLDNIESNATADQSNAEIRAAVAAATDSNVFTDDDHSKLDGIEASATADQSNAEIVAAVVASTNISDANKGTIRSNIGVDAAGTDNSTDVTLGGSLDYITLSGQVLTRNAIDLSTDVTGTLPVGNMAATALTTIQTAANETAHLALTAEEGDVVVRSDENKTYMHNGGSAGSMADYTLLATPTDSVTSVNGDTGVVTVVENVTTNLSITGTTDARTIVSSDGTDAIIPVATDSVSGVMSSTDHTKLTGIEANATADQTGAEIKSAYEAENDTNAFTDALKTKLDDISGTNTGDQDLTSYQLKPTEGAFVNGDKTKLDAISGTNTGDQDLSAYQLQPSEGAFVNGDKTKLDAQSGTNTGDQDLSSYQLQPSEGAFADGDKTKLDNIATGANAYAIADDNASNVHFEGLLIGATTGATANTIRCVGDVVAYYSSDSKFKDNVEPLEGALEKIKHIRGVRFDWNDKQDVYEGHDIGVIAQEVEEVLPELVHYREHSDSKSVDYVKLTAVLIEAVKELELKVAALEKK